MLDLPPPIQVWIQDLKHHSEDFDFGSITNISPLKGGLTNDSFLLTCENSKSYVLRIPGEKTSFIDRDSEYKSMNVGYRLGVSPRIHAYYKGAFIIDYIDAPTLSFKHLINKKSLNLVLSSLVKLQKSRNDLGANFDPILEIRKYKSVLQELGECLPTNIVSQDLKIMDAMDSGSKMLHKVPCHVDNIFGNILVHNNKVWLIDWEYSGMTDPYCDLVNLSLLNDIDDDLEKKILKQYSILTNQEINWNKYFYVKMSISYMWVFWHLIKYKQFHNVEYNNRRWKERFAIALAAYDAYKKG